MNPISTKENLKREIGLRSFVFTILNSTVGTGIFVIPAIIAEDVGAAAILAYLVCGVAIFLIALCFAEVGSGVTSSGGIYTYIETAFGPFAGFLANNAYWLGCCVIADGAIANALADTLKYFIPPLDNAFFRIVFFIFLFGGLAIINIRSVKNGVRFIEFATIGKLIPLLLLVIVGSFFISTQNLRWTLPLSVGNLGTASLLLFFAFTGIEVAVSNGGEIKNPKRTVPLGISLGIFFVFILYTFIQIVTQGVLGDNILRNKNSPLAAVAGIIFGNIGTTLVIATTIISILGVLSGGILGNPRILYAGARDGLMPKVLSKVHSRFSTPHRAIGFYALLGFLFAVSGGFKQLATISVAATLLIYLGVVLATIKLRKTSSTISEKTFRIPGGIIVPVLAICVIAGLLYNLTKTEFFSIGIFIIVFSLIYLLMLIIKKRNKDNLLPLQKKLTPINSQTIRVK